MRTHQQLGSEVKSVSCPCGAQRGLVAQICNLPYRRFVIGRASERSSELALLDAPQNAILRYSAARQSRNQRSADSLVRQSELTTDEHADKAVRAPKKSSRLATISTDTDRLQICATPKPYSRPAFSDRLSDSVDR